MKRKIFFAFFAICFLFSFSFSFSFDTLSCWKTLEKAERAFDENNLGSALVLAQNAKEMRKSEYLKCIDTIQDATSPLAVQQAGDSISDTIYILDLRNSNEAIDLLNSIMNMVSKDRFNDSLKELLIFLDNMQHFPEADFLIGKIFLAEGEYTISEKYLKQALQHKDILDVPDVEYDILYEIAYLAELQNNFDLYEESLLAIVAKSDYYTEKNGFTSYTNAAAKFAKDVKATVYGQVETASQKFFLLYRVDSKRAIPAFYALSEYYSNKNNAKSFNFSVLGALASFSRINEILTNRKNEYEFSTLNDFFENAMQFSDINEWMLNNNVWEQFEMFAKELYKNDNKDFAIELIDILDIYCPIEYIKKSAKAILN